MKVTDAKFIPWEFIGDPSKKGLAKVQIDNCLWLLNMIVFVDFNGAPRVHFPARNLANQTKRRVHYHIDGPLREEVFAAVVEQYELYVNRQRQETDINHQPVKSKGSNRCLTFG